MLHALLDVKQATKGARGFTLIEVMLTVAIVGILASMAQSYFQTQIMLTKRTEAFIGLSTIWKAQRAFAGTSGRYAGTFDELGFDLEGGTRVSEVMYAGKRYTYQLSQPWGSTSFYCIATAQLDNDDWPDILETYETNGE